jgi:exosome complex component RRP41
MMTYKERFDKRKNDETRPISAKAGVIKNADGSAWFKIGKTEAYAAVYGPRNMYPKFLQDPSTGILRCHYNMLPYSGSGERVRPGQNRRAKEISMVMEKALLPVVDLTGFPNSVVDVYVDLPQTDAGSRCAAICASSIALADAGIPMKEMVSAVAVGRVDEQILVDLEYEEEAYEDGPVADIPIAYLNNSNKLSLLQMDGEITKEMIMKALELGVEKRKEINDIQVQALKDKYINAGDNNE